MTLKTYRFYGYLIALALASSLLVKLTEFDELSRDEFGTHNPDTIGKAYSKWVMDEQGQLKNKLLAEEVRHYADDGSTHFFKPTLFFYENKTPPWIINAESGILSGNGDDLALHGKVAVERAKAKGVSELIIHTSELNVKPKTRHAQTAERADLISSPHTTSGTGMSVVFTKPVYVKLLARVRGKYASH